jgi:geranylgeranyl diphosphate synthase type I
MSQNQEFTKALTRYAAAIDAEIKEELGIKLDEFMRGAISYQFGWVDENFIEIEGGNSGKKLRPVMYLLAYQACHPLGFDAPLAPALPVAACLEMIHNYSLVHDDIEDDDRARRGRPTIWALWGKPKAINVGDCLHVLAFRRLYRAANKGLTQERTLRIAESISDMSVKLSLGQHKDMSFEDTLEVTPEMYIDMIGGKTAAIFSCALECAAIAGLPEPLDESVVFNLATFGLKIGLAFQIRDDILGIWGLSSETGKPSGSDIRRRKKSLPVIYALTHATGADREQLLEIYHRTDSVNPSEEQFIMDAFERCGAKVFSQNQAEKLRSEAEAALAEAMPGAIEKNPPLKQLHDLCAFLVERSF